VKSFVCSVSDNAYYAKKSWKIPKGAMRRTDNTMVKRTKHTYKNKMTSHYKRYAKPCMSPTGTNKTNKGLHITSGMPSRVWAPQG
jgi:hypothetical protein